MTDSQVTVHIVYVHGFQGDHTTFQSFPTDLHKALLPQVPSHVTLRSILYPTYKSKRPISVATQNLLDWLDTLPYGPVILCGHSMGGLLVAEAATSQTHSAARRVVALLAFDVPFLGMHPHVVISGIASLFPNKKGDSNEHGSERDKHEGGGLKSEREMNDKEHVHVPADGASPTPSPSASKIYLPNPPTKSLTTSSGTPPPLPPRPSSKTLTPTLSPRSVSSSNSHSPTSRPRSPSPTPAIISRTIDFVESHSKHPLVRFISKNHADPLGAAKRWVVESFEFGVCMFDPKGLTARYGDLQKWSKPWVAFWTETAPGSTRTAEEKVADELAVEAPEAHEEGLKKEQDATAALGRLLEPTLPETGPGSYEELSTPASPPPSLDPAPTAEHKPLTKEEQKAVEKSNKDAAKRQEKELKARQKTEKALRKQQDKELKELRKQNDEHPQSAHHFIVRPFKEPTSATHRWEQVKIRGAKDEVEAHCGLFLRDVNWEYDAFVERVSVVVRGWIDGLDGSIS